MLTAKAMIAARPKTGTRVRPKADWNLLDPEVLPGTCSPRRRKAFVADLFVLRQMVEPAAAALAAEAKLARHHRPHRRRLSRAWTSSRTAPAI